MTGSTGRQLRERLSALSSAADRRPPTAPGGTSKRLVQVYDGGSMGAGANLVYLTHPVQLDGMESEGGAATPTPDTTQTIPVVFLGHAPSVGDIVPAFAVGGRWVAERGMGSSMSTIPCVWACSTTVTIAAPSVGDDDAFGLAAISGGSVSSIAIISAGSGYTALHPSVTISAPTAGGTTATAQATVGGVTSAAITSGGHGYTTATVAFSAAPAGGITATGTATISGGLVVGIAITDPGGLYTSNPTVTISGDGTGATGVASAGVGMVTAIAVTGGGSGYVAYNPPPTSFSATLAGNGVTLGPYTLEGTAGCEVTVPGECAWSIAVPGITWPTPLEGSECPASTGSDLYVCLGPYGEIIYVFGGFANALAPSMPSCTSRPYSATLTVTINPALDYLNPGAMALFQALGGSCTNLAEPPATTPTEIVCTITVSES